MQVVVRTVALLALLAAQAHADEPGIEDGGLVDEPAVAGELQARASSHPRARLELGFGYASLLEDPDVGEGYGGGLFFAYEVWGRVGGELSVYFGRNPYEGQLGSIGTSFLAGNVTAGPVVRLTPPGSRISVSADLATGAYLIIPGIQENIWTLGFSLGFTVSLRIASWFGLTIKPRYHLFNVANFAGPELRDLKALMKVGVIDRLEIPVCLGFFF